MRRLGVAEAIVGGQLVEGDVAVDDGQVLAVGLTPPGRGGLAAPGYVDWQINGYIGVDFRLCELEELRSATAAMLATGVTSCLPTLFSATLHTYRDALAMLAAAAVEPLEGARVLGAHLEGPFLALERAGAHEPATFLEPDRRIAESLLASGPVRVVTIAPELEGAIDLIRYLRSRGVVTSLGHTDASVEQCRAAVAAGATAVTHMWNAHRGWTAREPGPAGAAFSCEELTVGVIADLTHVAPETLLMTFREAPGRVSVVSDAISRAGTDGAWRDTWGDEIQVDGRAAFTADGTLVGSVTTLDRAVRNLIELGLPPVVAIDAATRVPARLLGLDGSDLTPGTVADLVVLTEDFDVRQTWIDGEPRFEA